MNQKTVTTFASDIAKQPEALRELISYYRAEGQLLLEWADNARMAGRVLFLGMGTSHFAPDMVLLSLQEAGIDAVAEDASEMLHYPRPIRGLLTLISQSGESIETRKLAERYSGQVEMAAIVNNQDSTIARAASLTLPMLAGEESTISAKTYVNTLGVLYLMACALHGADAIERGLDDLNQIANKMNLVDKSSVEHAVDLLLEAGAIHMISRGPSMVAAKQAALTFQEGSRIPACALTAAAFRHGPFELVGPGHHCIFFIPGGKTTDLLVSMAQEMAQKGSSVITITDQDIDLPAGHCCVLRVPEASEELFAFSAATTQELIVDALALRRGIKTGQFRHGTKVTTTE